MNIAELQPVSEQETSSIPSTSIPFWTSIRSKSEPTSPTSELSNESDKLSEISELELKSPISTNSLPNSIHTNTESPTSYNLQPILSDPSTHLSLPNISLPNSKMSPPQYTIPALAQLPNRGGKNAPETFKGSYKHVETFINHYNRLIDLYHVISESDKCHGILEYCSQHVKDFIQINPHYLTPNWTLLQNEILNAYDADRMNSRIRPKDFFNFIQSYGQGQITNLSQWKRYHRDYTAKAGFLRQNKQLNELQYHGYFWYGIPHHLQGILESRLHAKNPTFDTSQPWPIDSIKEIAEMYFRRTKFTSQLPHLPSLGYEEDEDEDSDSDYEYDSYDSDDYDDDRNYRHKHKSKKKKKKSKSKSKRDYPPTQTVFEEPSRNIVSPPEEKGMEGLIQRLNTMSLDDPQYGTLYYQAVSKDKSGLVAQCINRKPKQISLPTVQAPFRDIPPHRDPPREMQQPYSRGIIPRQPGMQMSNKCYGCFDIGHPLRDCPKMAQLINRGEVRLDPQTLKYLLPNGQPLFRQRDECLLDTLKRMRPTPSQGTVQFATLSNKVNKFHSKASKRSYLQFSYSDTEDDEDEYDNYYKSESESESEDEYEEGHWKYKLQQRKINPTYTAKIEAYDEDEESQQELSEFPTYVAYENEEKEEAKFYKSYPAERSEKAKSTRQARDSAMNDPIKRNRLDGVYMPPRRSNRSTEKLPENVSAPVKPILKHQETSKPKENIPPPFIEPIPVDARKPRFKDDNDVLMKEPEPKTKTTQEESKSIILQDHVNQSKSQAEKNSEPNTERTRSGPRQSELSNQTDSKVVVEQILNTQVSLPLRQILGASRELSNNFQDVIRYKNPNYKPPTQSIAQRVYNSMQGYEAEITSDETQEKFDQEKGIQQNRLLIQLTLHCRGKPISAIIDTGSQLNVVRKRVAETKIRLPVDISKEIVMNDVNGNAGLLSGMIRSVPLQCGSVITEATDVYIGKTLPCDLLLGRPWQRGNLVSIDERTGGTYLVFKDSKTSEPRYEICITPEILYPETFKPYTKKAKCLMGFELENIISEAEETDSEYSDSELTFVEPTSTTEPSVISNWIIGYGPYKNIPEPRSQFMNFDYRVYFYLSSESFDSEKLQIVRGNHPYQRLEFVQILSDYPIYFFEQLDRIRFLFLMQVLTQYYVTQETSEGTEVEIPKALLQIAFVKPYEDRRDIFNPYDTFQYPEVEEILKVATIIIHQPDGQLRQKFIQHYPEEASELFEDQNSIFSVEETLTDSSIKQYPKIEKEEEQESTSIPLANSDQTHPKIKLEGEFNQQISAKNIFITGSSIIQAGSSKTSNLIKEIQEKTERDPFKEDIGYQNMQPKEIKAKNIFISGSKVEQSGNTNLNALFEQKHENINGDLYTYSFFGPNRLELGESNSELNCQFKISNTSHQKMDRKGKPIQPEKANTFNSNLSTIEKPQILMCRFGNANQEIPIDRLDRVDKQKFEAEDYQRTTKQAFQYIPPELMELDSAKLGNNKSEPRVIQTTPHSHSPTMEALPGSFNPPQDSPLHPILNISMYEMSSSIAREHGRMVFDNTTMNYDPSTTLAVEATNSYIATNRIVPEIPCFLPFSCAELVVPATILNFTHQGTSYNLRGDSYMQFTYFTGDPEAQAFHEAYNCAPPSVSTEIDGPASMQSDPITPAEVSPNSEVNGSHSEISETDHDDNRAREISTPLFLPSPTPSLSPRARAPTEELKGGEHGESGDTLFKVICSRDPSLPAVPTSTVFLATVAGPLTSTHPNLFAETFLHNNRPPLPSRQRNSGPKTEENAPRINETRFSGNDHSGDVFRPQITLPTSYHPNRHPLPSRQRNSGPKLEENALEINETRLSGNDHSGEDFRTQNTNPTFHRPNRPPLPSRQRNSGPKLEENALEIIKTRSNDDTTSNNAFQPQTTRLPSPNHGGNMFLQEGIISHPNNTFPESFLRENSLSPHVDQFGNIPHPSHADPTSEIENGDAEYHNEHEFLQKLVDGRAENGNLVVLGENEPIDGSGSFFLLPHRESSQNKLPLCSTDENDHDDINNLSILQNPIFSNGRSEYPRLYPQKLKFYTCSTVVEDNGDTFTIEVPMEDVLGPNFAHLTPDMDIPEETEPNNGLGEYFVSRQPTLHQFLHAIGFGNLEEPSLIQEPHQSIFTQVGIRTKPKGESSIDTFAIQDHPIHAHRIRFGDRYEENIPIVSMDEEESTDEEIFPGLKEPRQSSSPGSSFITRPPSFKLKMISKGLGNQEIVPETLAPIKLLAYGPFPISVNSSENLIHFEYRIFIHHAQISTNNLFRIAFGNWPYYPVVNLLLQNNFTEEDIARLSEEHVQLIVVAAHFLSTQKENTQDTVKLRDIHLTHAYPSPPVPAYNYQVYRYPFVEIALVLASSFVNQPQGELAQFFRRWHSEAAELLFNTSSLDQTTLDHSPQTSSSGEWEKLTDFLSTGPSSPPGLSEDSHGTNIIPPSQVEEDELDIYESEEEVLARVSAPTTPYLSPLNLPLSNTFSGNTEIPDLSLPSPSLAPCSIDIQASITEAPLAEALNLGIPLSQEAAIPVQTVGWNFEWAHPSHYFKGKPLIEEDLMDSYKGPVSELDDEGILAYGPFPNSQTSFPHEYRIYLHPTSGFDVLEYFAYGGPELLEGKDVHICRLPISPCVINSTLDCIREYSVFIHQVEAYLRGDPRFKEGVVVPPELMKNSILLLQSSPNQSYYRFPLVEQFFSSIAARNTHPRFAHPFGRLTLHEVKHIVSPKFPVLQNPHLSVMDLHPPDLPYVQVKFGAFEYRHPNDTTEDLPTPYFGCLRRYEAFLFQKYFPIYGPQLYHEAASTTQLVAIHANQTTRPPLAPGGRISWDDILEPYSFEEFFPSESHSKVLLRACPTGSTNNSWFPRIQYLLQCSRHINQLIRAFETFFLAIGFDGLRELADQVWLNREVDFLYNPLLSKEQAVYFTTLYDFLLREHAIFIARPILKLLHISFPDADHLQLVQDEIVDTIEPPLYSYQLYDCNEDSSSSSSSSSA
jgi:hypothetical protein